MLQRQRGAFIFITPVILTLIVLFTVMAVDGARIYGVRNDLQNQANAAASAGAEATQACGGVNVSVAAMKSRALAAAQAQGFSGAAEDLDLRVGVLVPDPDSPSQLLFQEVNDIAASNAVRVLLSREESISRLLPESVLGSITLSASTAVRKEVRASLSAAGSTLAVHQGVLGGLLGAVFQDPSYTLDPTSLSSLENTFVELGEVLSLLGVDNLEDALPLGADELAAALREIAGNATPAGELLDDLVGAAGISTLQISDILTALGDTRVPDNNPVELLGLVNSLLLNVIREQQLLNGAALALTNLGALPLISAIDGNSLEVNLYVNRAPKYIFDVPARKNLDGEWEGVFYAPDISLEVIVQAGIPPLDLLGLVKLELADLTIPLAVDLGGGSGYLSSAMCARGVSNEVQFGMELERQLLELGTGTIDPDTGDVVIQPIDANIGKVSLLAGLLTIDSLLNLEAEISGGLPGESASVMLEPDYPLYCSPQDGCSRRTYEDPGAGLSGLDLDVDVTRLALLETQLGAVDLTPLVGLVTPLVSDLLYDVTQSLTTVLVNPLLEVLGVGVGGINVTVTAGDQSYTQLIENVRLANEGEPL
ncbi:pilus assembly protein TadG-related protein [Marinobacter zhejiangensis]|uniref:Uncharacterized membrane protein n=1 Tax=Marinobacter zhejiangensis TaxID=488535 RepID=A0A1I4M8I1_9GAMM|nr:pilus assembly protein TadG-related protein [Marinobacter zhejiangensis]SFL99581.1 Uncharacterized membrane protein [Marinobacter zhejiangensis]